MLEQTLVDCQFKQDHLEKSAQNHIQMALNISQYRDSTASLGTCASQCSATFAVKKTTFLMFRQNILCYFLFYQQTPAKRAWLSLLTASLWTFLHVDEILLELPFLPAWTIPSLSTCLHLRCLLSPLIIWVSLQWTGSTKSMHFS